MIVGLGTDIVELARLEQALERRGDAFLARAFTPAEIAIGDTRNRGRLAYFAGRWAAKEAIAKALGCGFGGDCAWHDIEILNNDRGAPLPTLSGQAAATAARHGETRLHLSISHEANYAVAMAVLELDSLSSEHLKF